jgi:hypothetical protein
MQRTCVYRPSGRIMILVHGEANVTREEWSDLRRLAEENYRKPADERVNGYLIVTDGGGPTSAQRAEVSEYWQGKEAPKFAVVSDSALVRGIVTALQWLKLSKMTAFRSANIDSAIAHVGIPESEHHAVLQTVLEMRSELHRLKSKL